MTWLDEAPVDWRSEEPKKLSVLLVQHYPSWGAAYELAQAAGVVSGSFPCGGTISSSLLWHEVINTLSAQLRLRPLVEIAAETYNEFQEFLGDDAGD